MIDQSRDAHLNEALELMFFGYREFTSHPDAILAKRGLQRVHHRVLYFVGRNPGISVTELLGILGVSKQALNAPLRTLVEEGLVASTPADHDRRVRELELTREGARLETELSESQREMLETVFSEAGPRAEASWRRVMRAIVEG